VDHAAAVRESAADLEGMVPQERLLLPCRGRRAGVADRLPLGRLCRRRAIRPTSARRPGSQPATSLHRQPQHRRTHPGGPRRPPAGAAAGYVSAPPAAAPTYAL